MPTNFFPMVKTKAGEKQKDLRVSGTSATFKLTDSVILCITLSLPIDKLQISSTLGQK